MKLLFFIISFSLLANCTNFLNERERIKLKKEETKILKQKKEDKLTCNYYGFKEDTDAFSNCLMNLDLARKEQIITRKMLECEAIKRDNKESKATGFWAGVLKGARENLAC
jgi:hypothetical protein